MHRYLDILDPLYADIVNDMKREGFTVNDKYKAKYEELGKLIRFCFSSSDLFHFSSFLYFY